MFCFTRPDINRPKADHSNKPVSSGERKETEIEVTETLLQSLTYIESNKFDKTSVIC